MACCEVRTTGEASLRYDGSFLFIENLTHLKGVELRHEVEARPRKAVSLALAIRFATRTISCARSATDIRNRSRI